MKKYLVLALSALALVACGNVTPTTAAPTTAAPTTVAPTTAAPTTVAPTSTTVTIDKDDQTELKAAIAAGTSGTYHTDPVNFETDNTKWTYSPDAGLANAQYNAEYGARGVFQFKKNSGSVYNSEALTAGYSKVTVKFYATYETQEEKYLPVVKEGTAADALTAVTANEAAPVTGTDAGFIGSVNSNTGVEYQAYDYTITYNVKADSTFFSIGAGAGALYLYSIVLEA